MRKPGRALRYSGCEVKLDCRDIFGRETVYLTILHYNDRSILLEGKWLWAWYPSKKEKAAELRAPSMGSFLENNFKTIPVEISDELAFFLSKMENGGKFLVLSEISDLWEKYSIAYAVEYKRNHDEAMARADEIATSRRKSEEDRTPPSKSKPRPVTLDYY